MTVLTAARHKRGGVFYEDFVPGEVVEHRYTRTVISANRRRSGASR
jgi:acyl dehydratase